MLEEKNLLLRNVFDLKDTTMSVAEDENSKIIQEGSTSKEPQRGL